MLIYPTRRAVALTVLGAPAGVLLGLVAPGLWLVGVAWAAMALGLVLVDAALGADRRQGTLAVAAPKTLGIGEAGQVDVTVTFAGGAPRTAEFALETNARLSASPDRITPTESSLIDHLNIIPTGY